jgi:hypothetical protein
MKAEKLRVLNLQRLQKKTPNLKTVKSTKNQTFKICYVHSTLEIVALDLMVSVLVSKN